MLSNIGTTEVLIIAIIILVFFGSKRLNDLAKGLGESARELKSAKKEYEEAVDADPTPIAKKTKASKLKNKKES